MAAPSIYTGTTTQDQTAAANKAADATANQSVMSTAQMPSMSATSQPGIIAGAMNATTDPAATVAPVSMGSAPTPDYTAQLNDIYAKELNRGGDAGGLDFYNKKIQSGAVTLDGVDAAIKGSAEYQAMHPAVPQTAYKPALLGTPTQWSVTPDQTVQGQMKNLIDPNNPYYQQWAAAGAADAAARGFTGNSSLRDTGILDSVMRGATPIATSDAATYAKSAGYNADQGNQFAVANQNATNTAGQVNAQLGVSQANAATAANTTKYTADKAAETSKYGTDVSAATSKYGTDANSANNKYNTDTTAATNKYGADITAATQKYLSDQNAATQLAVQKMSTQSQQTVSQLHDANSVLLQNNQSAQAAYTAYINAVANIDVQPSMDEPAKRAAIETQTMIFNQAISGLKTATPGTPDVSSPLDLTPAQKLVKQLGPDATDEQRRAAQDPNYVDVSHLLQGWTF